MAKKTYKMSKIEMFDTFVPIIAVCWVLVFAYISLFVSSSTLAMITVMPVFFLYAIYLVAGAYYCYKEVDVLKAFGKDTYEAEKRRRKQAPKLSKAKLITAGICFIVGILLCIVL